ncbi:MAG TPA: sulfotransferase domain-containing protein [Candidatus Sulfomarinibacteraceae bacterium]|nr:sulfotransferase domain-containing protein [Candidatus Sulfomarinibacteraceae bacterium]
MGFLRKLFKSSDDETVVVVSGLPRSGTSMMMKMLEAGGIPPLTDEIREADKDNPKGYYEFERVKQLDKGDTEWLPRAKDKAVKVISALLQHLPGDYRYRVIFMQRHMPEILASQRKMLAHRGEEADKMDDERMAELFEKHLEKVSGWLAQQPNFDVLYVHYSDALRDPQTAAESVNDFLQQDLDVERMVGVVDPNLYRNRRRELEAG